MPYDYYDSDGYLAPGPTIPQWSAMREQLTGTEGKVMADTGRTDDPLSLADELPDDEPTLQPLKRAAEQARGSLSISSGTQPEQP